MRLTIHDFGSVENLSYSGNPGPHMFTAVGAAMSSPRQNRSADRGFPRRAPVNANVRFGYAMAAASRSAINASLSGRSPWRRTSSSSCGRLRHLIATEPACAERKLDKLTEGDFYRP